MSDRKSNKANGQSVRLTDEQRIDWLRLIRSPNIGPRGMQSQYRRGIVARTPQLFFVALIGAQFCGPFFGFLRHQKQSIGE